MSYFFTAINHNKDHNRDQLKTLCPKCYVYNNCKKTDDFIVCSNCNKAIILKPNDQTLNRIKALNLKIANNGFN